jgi:hypothetical protein
MACTTLTATVTTANRGNLAIQSETFTIPLELAAAAVKFLDTRPGCYWESAAKAVRRAKRAGEATVKLYTAGFGSGQLAGAIGQAGGTTVSQ